MHALAVSEPGSFKLCARADLESEAWYEIQAVSALVREATRRFTPCGLLLTGSFARGEGTIVRSDAGGVCWLSDIECLLASEDRSRATRAAISSALGSACAAINGEPARHAKGLKIGVSPIGVGQLARMRPAIFSHELSVYGKLLWGEPAAIRLPAAITPGFDLRRDGLRLLHNRIVEKLAVRARLTSPTLEPVQAWYTLSKFWLDLGTSLLAFLGCYRPSYTERCELVESALAAHREIFEPPMVDKAAQRMREAAALKLGEMPPPEDDLSLRFDEAAEAAEQAWEWESKRLLDIVNEDRRWSRIALRLRQIESPRQRGRDWARLALRTRKVLKLDAGALGSMFRAGSFGSAIYAAGCLLDFYWGAVASGEEPGVSIRRMLGRLFRVEIEDSNGRREVTERIYRAWQQHLRDSAL